MCELFNDGSAICGGYPKLTKKKPKNWIETGYQILTPYKWKWRTKIGKVKCTCKEVKEIYKPYYGYTWEHTEECALMIQIKKRPQLLNLPAYYYLPVIGGSE